MSFSRWYNQVDEPAGAGSNISPEQVGALLQSAAQLGAAVKSNREATGAAADRRQRIAACGRRPIGIGKKHKKKLEAYKKCVADAGKAQSYKSGETPYSPPAPEQSQSNTMTYVFVGLGILAVATTAFFIFKPKK